MRNVVVLLEQSRSLEWLDSPQRFMAFGKMSRLTVAGFGSPTRSPTMTSVPAEVTRGIGPLYV